MLLIFETGNHTLPREQELEPLEGQTGFKAAASPETSTNWRSVHCPLAPLTSRGGRVLKAAKLNQEKQRWGCGGRSSWAMSGSHCSVHSQGCAPRSPQRPAGGRESWPGVPFCFIRSSILTQNRIPTSRFLWKWPGAPGVELCRGFWQGLLNGSELGRSRPDG